MSVDDDAIAGVLVSIRVLLLKAQNLIMADTEYLRDEIQRLLEQVDILLAKVEKEERMMSDKVTLLQ